MNFTLHINKLQINLIFESLIEISNILKNNNFKFYLFLP